MDLDQKARSILAHPESYPALGDWGSVELLLRIWQYPSFQHASSWTLGHREDGYRVRRLEWDHITDRRWPHGTPTIYGSEAALPDETAVAVLNGFAGLTVRPFVPAHAWGTDGIDYGVETCSPYLSARLTWWHQPPDSWPGVAAWFDAAAAAFDGLFPDSSTARNR